MNSGMFDEAIGEVPPSTVDVDAVMARGRRSARLRAVASPVVVVAAAVALTATASTAFPVTERGTTADRPAAATEDREESLPCDPDRLRPGGTEPVHVAISRLTSLTRQLVEAPLQHPDQVNGVTVARDAHGTLHQPLQFFPYRNPAYTSCEDDQFAHVAYVAHADVLWADQGGTISFAVSTKPASENVCGNMPKGRVQSFCRSFIASGGEAVFAHTEVADDQRENAVEVAKPDGTRIDVVVRNHVTHPLPGQPVDAEMPPLTVEQLQAIVLDPRMTLFP